MEFDDHTQIEVVWIQRSGSVYDYVMDSTSNGRAEPSEMLKGHKYSIYCTAQMMQHGR